MSVARQIRAIAVAMENGEAKSQLFALADELTTVSATQVKTQADLDKLDPLQAAKLIATPATMLDLLETQVAWREIHEQMVKQVEAALKGARR